MVNNLSDGELHILTHATLTEDGWTASGDHVKFEALSEQQAQNIQSIVNSKFNVKSDVTHEGNNFIVTIPRSAISAQSKQQFNQEEFSKSLTSKLEEVKKRGDTPPATRKWAGTPIDSPPTESTTESPASEIETFVDRQVRKKEEAASKLEQYLEGKLERSDDEKERNGELYNHFTTSFELSEEEIQKATEKKRLAAEKKGKTAEPFTADEIEQNKIGKRFASLGRISEQLPEAFLSYGDSRYSNVKCPEMTSIEVEVRENVIKVLHANHVHLDETHVICTQAPLQATENLYWMAAFENTNLLISLVHQNDLGKEKEGKVETIFPELNNTRPSGNYEITCTKQSKLQDNQSIMVSEYTITDKSKEFPVNKTLTRINYLDWPDLTALKTDDFINLIKLARENQKGDYPPMINCKAGVGRTGSLAVGMAVTQMIEQGKITKANYMEEIDKLILAGRYQRGEVFVQRESQYQSIILLAESQLDIKK